ncbi:unnamed protein product [Closterium sp. NIES-53]
MDMLRFPSIHAFALVCSIALVLLTTTQALPDGELASLISSRRSLAAKKLQCPSGAGVCPYRSVTTCSQPSIYCSGACCTNNVEYPCCGGTMCCKAGGCMKKHNGSYGTAFLQGFLHEEIWLCRPPGFTGLFPAGTQWSLRRPVYGLRQALREWHDTPRTTLAALGSAPATADPSLFLRTDTSLPPFYVRVYIDDLVFPTADTEALTLVKSELQKRHTCTDLGELRNYLGLQITRDRARRTITLTQSHMGHQVLQRFGFQFSSPLPTPLSTSHSLSAPSLDESVEPSGPYPELVGCLMYLMTCTLPDLAYPLSLLARYVARGRHRKLHRDAAKRVLRYLCSTSGMGLVLGGQGPVVLTSHADASWVDDSATHSSCEAEIYAEAMAAQELRWLTYLLTDLGEQPRSPPVLYVDNKAMIPLCQEHRLEHRTKHIALRYFLARELQQRGQLRLAYMATMANTSEIFTKALPPACFALLLLLTGLVTIACSCYPPLRLWGLEFACTGVSQHAASLPFTALAPVALTAWSTRAAAESCAARRARA